MGPHANSDLCVHIFWKETEKVDIDIEVKIQSQIRSSQMLSITLHKMLILAIHL